MAQIRKTPAILPAQTVEMACLVPLDVAVQADKLWAYPALIHGDRFRDQKLSNVATHVETCTIIVLLMIFKYILTEPGIYKCE